MKIKKYGLNNEHDIISHLYYDLPWISFNWIWIFRISLWMYFCNPIFKNPCLDQKNTLNFSFNNFPFSIIKLTIYLFLISGIIGVLSTMYHGINLLWENFSNELLISYTALIFSYLIIVIECFRIINVLKKIKNKSDSNWNNHEKMFSDLFYKKLAYYKEHRKRIESEHFPYDIRAFIYPYDSPPTSPLLPSRPWPALN